MICAIIMAVSLGTLVGCSITKENTEDGYGSLGAEDIQDENSQTEQSLPESVPDNNEYDSNENESANVNLDESATNQQESSIQTAESMNPETFPVGEYHDDMGSELIIAKVDDKNYTVTYGIYRLTYVEDAVGSYDPNSGVLSFAGTDIATEINLSADITIQGLLSSCSGIRFVTQYSVLPSSGKKLILLKVRDSLSCEAGYVNRTSSCPEAAFLNVFGTRHLFYRWRRLLFFAKIAQFLQE